MRFYRLKQFVLFLGDVFLIILATRLAPFIRFGYFKDIFQRNTGASVITLILYVISFYVFDLYNLERNAEPNSGLRCVVAVLIAISPITILFFYLPKWKYGRGIWVAQICLVWLFTFFWRKVSPFLLKLPTSKKENVLIIGAGKAGRFFSQWIEETNEPLNVVGFVDDDPNKIGQRIESKEVLGATDRLLEIGEQKNIKTAIVAIKQNISSNLIKTVLVAKLKGWEILDVINDYEKSTGKVPVEFIKDEWILFAEGFYILNTALLQRIKRLLDLLFAVFCLIASSPFIIITALAIRIESPGPVIYRQLRVGKDGKLFELWKFRSMVKNAESNGVVWAQKNDPRVTRVGRIIRLLRIDEIPQLVNVLRGEMSIIGPRPERPEFVIELEKHIPYYFIRHSVRPGITGWAQINYPYGASVQDALNKLEYDLYYIKNMSPILETKIVLKTIGVMFFGQGAR